MGSWLLLAMTLEVLTLESRFCFGLVLPVPRKKLWAVPVKGGNDSQCRFDIPVRVQLHLLSLISEDQPGCLNQCSASNVLGQLWKVLTVPLFNAQVHQMLSEL